MISFGLSSEQHVFRSEATAAASVVAKRFGGDPVIVRFNTRKSGDATIEALAATLETTGKRIDSIATCYFSSSPRTALRVDQPHGLFTTGTFCCRMSLHEAEPGPPLPLPNSTFLVVPSRGVADLLDSIKVTHIRGGISTIGLKSYISGRERFQRETLDIVWLDPPG